jgi:helix-turn-helix protein
MSIKAMVWAWEQEVGATEVLVLLALADHADDDGVCWPGQKGLARKTKLTRTSIQQVIGRLKDKGMLEVIARRDSVGRPLANIYQLSVPRGGKANVVGVGIANVVGVNPNTVGPNLHLESSKKETKEEEGLTADDLISSWNDVLSPLGLPRVAAVNAERARKIRLRLKSYPNFEWWNTVFNRIGKSKFLQGENPRGWRCTFDFLIDNDSNALKIYEGQYEQAEKQNGKVQAVR